MGCKIENVHGPKAIYDHNTCIACRPDYGQQCSLMMKLEVGVFYKKCSLIIAPEDACEPGTLISDLLAQKDFVVGVTRCDIDLTNCPPEDNYPQSLLINVGLDENYMCWPEGATAEQIDEFTRTIKGCVYFVNRVQKTPLPPQLQFALGDKEVVKAKAKVIEGDVVPVQPGTLDEEALTSNDQTDNTEV